MKYTYIHTDNWEILFCGNEQIYSGHGLKPLDLIERINKKNGLIEFEVYDEIYQDNNDDYETFHSMLFELDGLNLCYWKNFLNNKKYFEKIEDF